MSILLHKSHKLFLQPTLSLVAIAAMLYAVGCSQQVGAPRKAAQPKLASFETRAKRRAFDGAPPIVPHSPFGQSCITCHAQHGKLVPTIGLAPANPHFGDSRDGALSNCRQCHVFSQSDQLFAENSFQGLPQQYSAAQQDYAYSPPVIPHTIQMRANCNACHAGVAARPEIKCSHSERANCMQCHVESPQRDVQETFVTNQRPTASVSGTNSIKNDR